MERSDFIKRKFYELNHNELKFARENCFLADYQYLARHLVLNVSEINSGPVDEITNSFFTNEVLPLKEKFRLAGNAVKISELLKELANKMNILTYKVFSDNFDLVFKSEVLESFSSTYLLFDYAMNMAMKYFDDEHDSLLLYGRTGVIRVETPEAFGSVSSGLWRMASHAEHGMYERALEILEQNKEEKLNSYYYYKLWINNLLNTDISVLDEVFEGMKKVQADQLNKKGSVFRFYLCRFFLRCWKERKTDLYLNEFKSMFKDSIKFYHSNSKHFFITLNERKHIEDISALESVYAPYLMAYAFINKEIF